jgi:hypothetical protein
MATKAIIGGGMDRCCALMRLGEFLVAIEAECWRIVLHEPFAFEAVNLMTGTTLTQDHRQVRSETRLGEDIIMALAAQRLLVCCQQAPKARGMRHMAVKTVVGLDRGVGMIELETSVNVFVAGAAKISDRHVLGKGYFTRSVG